MIYWIVLLVILGLDQFSKYLITIELELGESIPIIGSWLNILRIHNKGAAFGILEGWTGFFYVTGAVVLIACIIYVVKIRPRRLEQVALGLISGGAVGNLVDRCWHGWVIDFISVGSFPVFNAADSAIVIGAGLMLIAILSDMKKEKQDEGTGGGSESEAATPLD